MTNPQPLFTGVGVALVTLFDDEHRVDTRATADLAVRLVDLGMRSIVLAGSTGEAAALTGEERSELVQAVRAAVASSVPVIAGVGAATGRQAAEYAEAAGQAGADGLLALSPHGIADPTAYFETLAKAAGELPLLAYHYPAMSAPGIGIEVLAGLPIHGIKDSSGDPERLLRELDAINGAVYVGSSAMLAMAGAIGAHGAILTLANYAPEQCIAAFEGRPGAQRELLAAHLRGTRNVPVGIKGLVAERFGTSARARIGS